jgi:hypothetical protein
MTHDAILHEELEFRLEVVFYIVIEDLRPPFNQFGYADAGNVVGLEAAEYRLEALEVVFMQVEVSGEFKS